MEAYIFGLVADLLPPEMAAAARHYLLRPDSPLQSCKRHLAATARAGIVALTDVAAGALAASESQGGGGGGVTGVVTTLALLAVSALLLRWLGRLVMWWTRFTLRLAWWASVVALCACVWQRGPVATLQSVLVGVGALMRYLAILRDVWLAEYNRYEVQERQQQQQRQFTASRARGSAW
ncbi:hypothetical protein L249_6761 [Ophiocordyceps polyrhachis-furcata BCC 54312]|uniref:Uncharacterized protein n=1 Tax=Ophiocordyceps polyrhachis-furcata BCC 54312 TaxID=1330021 RepID=A0A367LKJ5_9HYPO|nr:hypothetical protein L249_6761 [Ophiocordyceps polyrhachis-furcata BCC 54312]